jgi:hypothetical protein
VEIDSQEEIRRKEGGDCDCKNPHRWDKWDRCTVAGGNEGGNDVFHSTTVSLTRSASLFPNWETEWLGYGLTHSP